VAAGLTPLDEPSQEPLVLCEFLPFRLAVTAQAVSDLIAATCENRFGLSIPAWRMLCVLAEDAPLDADDLGYRAALDEPGARVAASILISRNLAHRNDQGFAITPSGQQVHEELAGLALAAQAALLAGLAPAEVRSLRQLLGRVEAAALKLTPRP
jgi:DNA-binding MarR family transcriptional regulator